MEIKNSNKKALPAENSKILIVDDIPENLRVLSSILKNADYTVRPALNGKIALKAVTHQPPDLILLDIRMPDMDGYEVIGHLKANPETKDIPVIFISAMTDVQDKVRAFEKGCVDFIGKPFQEEEVLVRVKTHLSLRTMQTKMEELVALRTQELTEKTKRLKKEIRERKILAAAIEQASESIVITDTEGVIQYYNPAFEKISGYPPQELLGKNVNILKSGKQDDNFYEQMWSTIKKGKAWNGLIVNQRKDGSLREESMTISPVRDEFKKIVNYVAVKYDVTHQRLLEKQLRQAQKMEAIGTLAGGIAHDFNNILQGILMSAQVIEMGLAENAQAKKFLSNIVSYSKRGADLIKQIMTFSRQTENERTQIQIALIVREAMKMMRSILPASIKIRQKYSDEEGVISGNSTQIHRIVMNLCTNAGHAMQEVGGVLRVNLDHVVIDHEEAILLDLSDAGKYINLSIEDTGTGISTADQEHIFEPFFTTKAEGKGTGLGLSVVHGIMKDHGGTIRVKSEIGKGTKFELFFPKSQDSTEKEPKKSVHNIVSPVKRKANILLVDDEEILVNMAKEMLKELGYGVTKANNGRKALDLFMADPDHFDLVLTDQTMPEMNGDELAKEILKDYPEFPVIIMTGYSQKIDHQSIRKLGVREIIAKPFDINLIRETLYRVLRGRDF